MATMDHTKEAVIHRQRVFVMTAKTCFMGKLAKYNGLLVKQGIHVDYNTVESLTRSHSFDDNIELILCESSASLQTRQIFKKIGNRLSLVKVVRWIYQLVQRTKAARILSHLNGVSQREIKDVIMSVATALSVSFEYQLMMLLDDGEIIKVARHAVSCMMFYLNTRGAKFTVKDLLTAVLEVKPCTSKSKEILKTHTVNADNKPSNLKWKLGQMFKQPGLRIGVQELHAELEGQIDSWQNESTEILGMQDICLEANGKVTESANITLNQEKTSLNVENDKGDEELEGDTVEEKCADVEDAPSKALVATEINLNEVSAAILGQNQPGKDSKPERRIKTIEMDFEMGKMHIEEHNVSVSDGSTDGDSLDMTDGMEEEMIDIAEHLTDDEQCRSELEKDKLAETADPQTGERISPVCGSTVSAKQDSKENFVKDPKLESDNQKEKLKDIADLQTVERIIEHDCKQKLFQDPGAGMKNNTDLRYADTNEMPCDNETDTKTTNTLANSKSDVYSVERKDIEYKFYGCFTPYGAKCCPDVYGFRSPLYVLDENHGDYTLIYNDKVSIRSKHNTELAIQTGNLHQTYRPKTKMIKGNIAYIQ